METIDRQSYSDLCHLEKDIEKRIDKIEMQEYKYLGVSLELLEEYHKQTDPEKQKLQRKLKDIKEEKELILNLI